MSTTDVSWLPPLAGLILLGRDVHVWRATLDVPVPQVRRLRETLSEDESRRAERFRFPTDRRRFIVARGLLRTILSQYLDVAPHRVRFYHNHYGKPQVAQSVGPRDLTFNLSHAGGLVLYAVARGRQVGVDVEQVRPVEEMGELASQVFSAEEQATWRSLPAADQAEAFFAGWTRKEAYVKARGEGLSMPLDQFDVSLAPDEPASLLQVREAPDEASRWSLIDLRPWPGYVAALAVEGHNCRLRRWAWPGL